MIRFVRRVLAWLGFVTDYTRPIILHDNAILDGKGRLAERGILIAGHNVTVRNTRIVNPHGDGIFIDPLTSDMVLVEDCDIGTCFDGQIDCASSEIRATSRLCRVTIRNNRLHDHDKSILLGGTSGTEGGPFRVQARIEGNHFVRVGQRTPSVRQYAFAVVVNNDIELEPFVRRDGSLGGCSGIDARFGGAAVSINNTISGPRPDRFVMGSVTGG